MARSEQHWRKIETHLTEWAAELDKAKAHAEAGGAKVQSQDYERLAEAPAVIEKGGDGLVPAHMRTAAKFKAPRRGADAATAGTRGGPEPGGAGARGVSEKAWASCGPQRGVEACHDPEPA